MALKPARPCRHPGCRTLTREGYCPQHKPKRTDDRSAEAKSWRWMYSTSEWKDNLRPQQLLEQPFCVECAKRGLRVRATDVDHVVDHKGSWAVFTDRGNLQSLCHGCHSRKTAAEMRKNRERKS